MMVKQMYFYTYLKFARTNEAYGRETEITLMTHLLKWWMRSCIHRLIYFNERVRTNTACDKKTSLHTCEHPSTPHPPPVFRFIAFNDSHQQHIDIVHMRSSQRWLDLPNLSRGGEKKSHRGDGLLRGLSSRPINHSLIRAHSEWGYMLRPNIRTKDFHTVCGQLAKRLFYCFSASFSSPIHPKQRAARSLYEN